MPVWSKRAGIHADVVWQTSQDSVVGTWSGALPVAVVPLWQDTQEPGSAPE